MQKDRRPIFLFLLVIIFFVSFLVGIMPDFVLHGTQLVNEQLHASIESLGAMAAISMSLLLMQFHPEREKEKEDFFLLSMGFLMMGILDAFVAVSVTGQGLNLLHIFRSIFGSIWFALVWLPGCGRYISKIKTVPWMVAFVSVLAGFAVLGFREIFPLILQNGRYTSFAILTNSITGVLLFAAALYFLKKYLRSSTVGSYLLTCVFMLLGLSSFGFRISINWTEDWWFWHIQRFLAYIVTLCYIFTTFLEVREELRKMNVDLEKRIAERTTELSMEVAQRKRYGQERDKVILELQVAANRIKVLTGLLPTCASCKKVRNSKGNWEQMESYIQKHSEAKFTHGICPECLKKLYPDLYDEIMQNHDLMIQEREKSEMKGTHNEKQE